MLEDVPSRVAAAPLVEKLGVHESREPFVDGALVESGDLLQQLAVEAAPEHRAHLGNDARGAEPMQPGEKQIVQRVRDVLPGAHVRQLPAAVRPPQRAGIAKRQHELLGEERHAVAALLDRRDQAGGRRRALEHAADERLELERPEWVERHDGRVEPDAHAGRRQGRIVSRTSTRSVAASRTRRSSNASVVGSAQWTSSKTSTAGRRRPPRTGRR